MTYPVCVDASLILRVLVPDRDSEGAIARLAQWRRDGATLLAPALLGYEVTSSLRRYVHFDHLTQAQGQRAYDLFRRIAIQLSAQVEILDGAWRLAARFRRPTAYDTAYLALAELRGCEFWTADRRLFNSVRGELSWVHYIGQDVRAE